MTLGERYSAPMTDLIFKDPRFDALRNAIYHTERRRFLDLLNRSMSFLVIFLGASAAAKWAQLVDIDSTMIELGIVFIATIQLVFDFGGSARVHEFLQRRYYELLSEIESEDVDNEIVRRKWSSKIVTITGDETMTMRALDALAYNKALAALLPAAEQAQYRQQVKWLHVRLRHVLAFHAVDFSPKS